MRRVDGRNILFIHCLSILTNPHSLAVVVACLIPMAGAFAKETKILWKDFIMDRPANFYEIRYSQRLEICTLLLSSLNQQYTPPRGTDYTNSFLHNEFIKKQWKKNRVIRRLEHNGQEHEFFWDLFVVDLNGDGQSEGVFRTRGHYGSGFEFESLYIESPAREDVKTSQTLTFERYKEIQGKPNQRYLAAMNEVRLIPPWITPSRSDLQDWSRERHFEIVKIADKYFILTANAFYWTTKNMKKSLNITLIEFLSPRNFSIICDYKEKEHIFLE